MQDVTKKTEADPKKRHRRSYDALKIKQALMEELSETGINMAAFLALTPREKRDRLCKRMRAWTYAEDEIPSGKSFSQFFNATPAPVTE
jgi:hypothetical protein